MTPFNRLKRLALTPLITPFTKRGPDLRALEASIARQIIAGIDGIVILDVVGEGQALRQAERDLLVSTCVRVAKPHLRVVVATGPIAPEPQSNGATALRQRVLMHFS